MPRQNPDPATSFEASGQSWEWLDSLVCALDGDFVEAATTEVEQQVRRELDRFFR